MQRTLLLLASALLLGGALLGYAETLHVPEDYPNIQGAIDAAAPGDRVFVSAGWYSESLTVDKPLVLEGENRTVVVRPARGLAGEAEGSVVSVDEPGGSVVIAGLTLVNGHTGVAVALKGGGSVTLDRCTVLDCTVGALCLLGNVALRDCVFRGNSDIGLFLGPFRVRIERCWISGSTRGVALMDHVSASVVNTCIVNGTRGISTFISTCEGETWPEEYRGTVTGRGNRIVVSEKALCPPSDSDLWPDGFLDSEGSRRLAEAQAVLDAASSKMYSDPSGARVEYEKACSLFEALDCPLLLADALQDLAFVLKGQYASLEALAAAETSRDLFLESGEVRGAAAAMATEGSVLQQLRLFGDAIAAMQAGLAIFSQLGDQVMGASQVEKSLGSCYAQAGEATLAIQHYRRAMDGFEELEEYSEAAGVGLVLGIAYSGIGAFENAVDVLRQSQTFFESASDGVGVFVAHWNLAVVYEDAGRFEEAVAEYERVLDAFPESADELNRVAVLLSYGDLLEKTGDLEEAEDVYRSVERWLAAHTGDLAVETGAVLWHLYHSLGQAQVRLRKLADALASFKRAILHVERIRGQLTEEAQRVQFQQSAVQLYADVIALLLELGSSAETFSYAERCRARTFLDLVATGPIGTLESIVEEGIRTGVVEASAIEADLAEVIATLPPDTAALEYFVTEDATYLWLIRDESASEPIRIEIDRTNLREQVLAFRTTIETPTTGLMDSPNEATFTMSRDLYELLIAPMEGQLEGIEHLVIVPSGPLYYLPFCALIDCPGCEGADLLGGTYLIERYSVSYAPSLTTLKYAWASAEEGQTGSLFLALADPDSGDAEIPHLPEAQDEATAVAGLFVPNEVYVGVEATEEVMAARAGEADQILLSTHASFNPANPMFSYLLLSPAEESDGRLYTHEIFGLDLDTDLVTLSACETLLPALEEAKDQVRAVRGGEEEEHVELTQELLETLTAGDEIVGLTRAFLYAGPPSVLSSLWRVVSETTEPLMVAFYQYLKDGLGKADALRQAQLDVMGSYPHPRYWAAFELMGDWR